jgi:hypothetical protein
MSIRLQRWQRDVASRRARIESILDFLQDLLMEIAEADAEDSWCSPAVPTDAVPARMQDLTRHVRGLFVVEEDERCLDQLLASQPELREELEQINLQHEQILDLLEEICELAGSSVRPATSWDDLELHFRMLRRLWAAHRHDEDAVLTSSAANLGVAY